MSERTVVKVPNIPAPSAPLSLGIKSGGLLFVSGQIPADLVAGELCTGTIAEKTRVCLRNINTIAKASGTDLCKSVKLTVFLTDMNDFAEVNGAYTEFFPSDPPARSCVQVAGLPRGVNVEIEAIIEL